MVAVVKKNFPMKKINGKHMVTLETWGSKEEAIAATINSPLRCKKSYPQPRTDITQYIYPLRVYTGHSETGQGNW